MTRHSHGRESMVDALRRELIGPAPAGPVVDLTEPFETKRDSYGPFVTADGEEVLGWTRPIKRYGVGVLFPAESRTTDHSTRILDASSDDADDADAVIGRPDVPDDLRRDLEQMQRGTNESPDESGDTADLAGANARRPSSMGITFALAEGDATQLRVIATGGRYERRTVTVEAEPQPRTVHVRHPFHHSWDVDVDTGTPVEVEGAGEDSPLRLSLTATVRPPDAEGTRLVTIALVNRSGATGSLDERCSFQTTLAVSTVMSDGNIVAAIPTYPGPPLEQLDDDERSLALLYRDFGVFGAGHNCAADWDARPGDQAVDTVRGVPLPMIETPSTTPDVEDEHGVTLAVPMAPLAGLQGSDTLTGLEPVIDAYESWIEARSGDAAALPQQLQATADAHLEQCRRAARRMREGLSVLRDDATARRAFELANRAILVQQQRSELRPRTVTSIGKDGGVTYASPQPVVPLLPREGRGAWRPFQVAFMLASLASTVDGQHDDREDVELIFFPTGGGKTEAYLGLAAFSILLRRLRDPDDTGVDVLMRYTLRLLTAQQFLRATRLVCALEDIRRGSDRELGRQPFGIGIWLGSATTPNSRRQAVAGLRRLERDPAGADDPFLLGACPWCGAEIGAVRAGRKRPAAVVGYREDAGRVVVHCPDNACAFHDELPVALVDEDVYASRPDIIIGTVDKFAMLGWNDEARAIFGLGPDGERDASPPNLIVQDELHLISGPLGSMVGLYEMTIEELATDRRGAAARPPKIVTSTATIRGFDHQVRALFGRTRATIFPPHGLSADDSFFARYATDENGDLRPGRAYLGVHASNHTSLIETQVSVMAAALQGAQDLDPDDRDPWWSQLVFFNSLRELGTSLSLVQSNVPMQLRAISQRDGLSFDDERRIRHAIELTSRLRNDEVPKAIEQLERRVDDERPVDICLASNIIEVGIDIDRLSLLLVVGQPKTTSQYIQVTGRIGRRWWERPGLVVTMMNPNRTRDRSHFEGFRNYHQRLYAHVEPTSVTPFSPPAVDRALHGALVAYLRCVTDLSTVRGPSDVPQRHLDRFREMVEQRTSVVDPRERERTMDVVDDRLLEFTTWARDRWARGFDGDEGLLVPLGEDLSSPRDRSTWRTPMSMRTVDAECELHVTTAYAMDHIERRRAERG